MMPGPDGDRLLRVATSYLSLIFAFVSAAVFLYGGVSLFLPSAHKLDATAPTFQEYILIKYGDMIIAIIVALFSAFISFIFHSQYQSSQAPVIKDSDRSLLEGLIREEKTDGIDQYIRLASLSGFSGTFTKLGFTGLPLATVGLTLILLSVSMMYANTPFGTNVFDLAKLTLGAFIGSFVQRNVTAAQVRQRGDRHTRPFDPSSEYSP